MIQSGFHRFTQRPAAPLAALLLFALVPRLIVAVNAVAPARDAARYWAGAALFESQPPSISLREASSLPGYPAALAGLHQLALQLGVPDGPWTWFRLSQAWGIVCSLTFVGISFETFRRMTRSDVAWLGVLAASWLPRQVGYSCDVLSDSMFAALWSASFLCLVIGLEGRRLWTLAAAGFFAGGAMLTRAEGVVLPTALVLATVLELSFIPPRSPLRSLRGLFVFSLPLCLVVGLYVAASGRYSPSNSAKAMFGEQTQAESVVDADAPTGSSGEGSRLESRLSGDLPLGAAARLLAEIAQESRGILLLLAVGSLGAVWNWRERTAGWRLACLSFLVVCGMLLVLRMRAGFLSSRYLTPVMPMLGVAAVAGAERWLDLLERCSLRVGGEPSRIRWAGSIALVAATTALCAPAWFRPLHRHRASHMEAAAWLKARASADDAAIDATWLVSFFAEVRRWAPGQAPAQWVVVDPSQIAKADARARRVVKAASAEGVEAASFAKSPHRSESGVVVYRTPKSLSDAKGEVWK